MLFAFTLMATAGAQEKIGLKDAAGFAGDTIQLCERVIATEFKQGEPGRPTYLILANDNTDQQITIIIRGNSRRKFDYKPEKDLLNRHICVVGKLEVVDGKLQMVITRQDDINIVNTRR